MRDFRVVITSTFLALAAWTATVNPSRADTGTVHVLFSTAGVVAGVGDGKGTLRIHGKTYPFGISGGSFGATLALTVTELEGRALNLRTPGWSSRHLHWGRNWWCDGGRNRSRAVAKREWGNLGGSWL